MLIRIHRRRRGQDGVSLVELMIGIAVGMFVVAAAATMTSTQLTDNRRLMLEMQVQQDLRSALDIITRDIRRAGAMGPTTMSQADQQLWIPGGADPADNVDSALGAVTLTGNSEIQFSTVRRQGTQGPYGYKLFTNTALGVGVIRSAAPYLDGGVEGGAFNDLTDVETVNVTRFVITEVSEPPVRLACPRTCADGTRTCWPTVTVRSFDIFIEGKSRSDPSVVRQLHSVARLRNDRVFLDPTVAPNACPT